MTTEPPLELTEIYALLDQAFAALNTVPGRGDRCAGDTALAIGEALGTVAKAKALMGRDIDQRPAELAVRIEQLIADARDEGLSDEAIVATLSEAVEALKEGLS